MCMIDLQSNSGQSIIPDHWTAGYSTAQASGASTREHEPRGKSAGANRLRYSAPVLVIVNPAAAGGRVNREWPRLEQRLRQLGLEFTSVRTQAPAHATELAENAVLDGQERVVAVGGDGTVCEVAEGLYRAGSGILAVLPAGTGNDIARMFGVPKDLDGIVRLATSPCSRAVDMIKVDDHVVLNAIGIGLVGDINRRAARIKCVRGIAAYLVSALVSILRYHAPAVVLRTPGERLTTTISLIAVQNGPTTGGGFRLAPRAVPDDGLLDACLVTDIGFLGRLSRLVAGIRGTLGQKSGSFVHCVPWLELDHSEPIPAHLDGNQYLLEPPQTRFEIVPAAVQVVSPY